MKRKAPRYRFSNEAEGGYGNNAGEKPGDSFGCFTLGRYLGSGHSRRVYAAKGYPDLVIKVARSQYTVSYNRNEARIYKKYSRKPHPAGMRFAACHLLANGWLVMEKVRPMSEPLREDYNKPTRRARASAFPEWSTRLDSEQVGRNKKGEVVAFDYGSHAHI